MRYKKIITASLFMIFSFQSCFFFEDCPDTLPHFSINKLNIQNVKFTNVGQEPWELISNDVSVEWGSYFMRVLFDVTFIAKQTSSFSSSSLYALDCLGNGSSGTKSGIDTLFVVTLNDYNTSFAKNDTINDIILINYWSNTAEQFNNIPPLSVYIEENRESISIDRFEIKLAEGPTHSEQMFKIILRLKDGQSFEAISDKVFLK